MAKKASDNLKYYQNPNGPAVAVVSRKVIEKDGLYFKDIDGTGEVSAVNDWRLSPEERAEAYVKSLTIEEKIAQLFISDWRMGPKYPAPVLGHVAIPDESGILDDAEMHGKTIFGEQHQPGTTTLIKDWFSRHFILRANPTPDDLADFLNQLHAVAEECDHFVPVQAASNSRNENGEVVYGMNDAAGVFATWPGTMGIAAAVKGDGDDLTIIDKFADCIRREWDSTGLKKGYMYMADVVTDPRWQRTYGTFGEDPVLVEKIMEHLIPGIQGSEEGVTTDGVSVTIKHFPGGGPRENGFDPHYAAGQWNVYATPGSLQKYHLPTFRPAVKYNAASIMPYYSKPAAAKSAEQVDLNGNKVEMNPYGFAYNKFFVDKMLRKDMGFKKEDLVLTDESIDRAVSRTLAELFRQGMFENPYRDPKKAVEAVSNETDWKEAAEIHRKSVVLLKNDDILPLTAEKLNGKKVYAEAFCKKAEAGDAATKALREMLCDVTLTDNYNEADIAILMVSPSSGDYFSATMGYLELDICEGKTVCDVDNEGKPVEATHIETTLTGANKIADIAKAVHANGGKVVANINVTLAWEVGNVERNVDALTVGFDTYPSATLDVMFGRFAPVGKLPITLPKGDEVLAVNADGVCISPNDVPGYDKDKYMPDSMKDENGKAYAYRDATGNYYELNFGLCYEE